MKEYQLKEFSFERNYITLKAVRFELFPRFFENNLQTSPENVHFRDPPLLKFQTDCWSNNFILKWFCHKNFLRNFQKTFSDLLDMIDCKRKYFYWERNIFGILSWWKMQFLLAHLAFLSCKFKGSAVLKPLGFLVYRFFQGF